MEGEQAGSVGAPDQRDRELVARMAEGDRAALDELYRAHADVVFTCVARITQDADADDLTHDAFLRAFERAAQYSGAGPVGAWLRRIGVNLALKRMRDRKRRLGLLRRRSYPPTLMARPAPAEAVDLERSIARLSNDLRVVFLLVAIEGRTHAQVASDLGITEAASRKRYQRARVQLATRLREDR